MAFTLGPFLHFTGILFQYNNYTLWTRHDKMGKSVAMEVTQYQYIKLIFCQHEKETWLRFSKTLHQKKHYPSGSFTCFVNTYAVDSVL